MSGRHPEVLQESDESEGGNETLLHMHSMQSSHITLSDKELAELRFGLTALRQRAYKIKLKFMQEKHIYLSRHDFIFYLRFTSNCPCHLFTSFVCVFTGLDISQRGSLLAGKHVTFVLLTAIF